MTYWLIHGAWHDETCWDLLAPLLRNAGHTVATPRLPIDDPAKQLEDYADIVLASEGVDPIIVGHSMSSDVAAIAASKGGARHVVYLCPRLAIFDRPEGEPSPFCEGCFDALQEDELERTFWTVEDALRCMYPLVEPALAKELAGHLRPQAMARRVPPPITRPPQVPSTFLYTTEDEIFRPEWSAWAARNIFGLDPVAWPGGHFPMLERPKELATFLLNLA